MSVEKRLKIVWIKPVSCLVIHQQRFAEIWVFASLLQNAIQSFGSLIKLCLSAGNDAVEH
jgi:uncharacterized phage infection (PIP) family protein YhgE